MYKLEKKDCGLSKVLIQYHSKAVRINVSNLALGFWITVCKGWNFLRLAFSKTTSRKYPFSNESRAKCFTLNYVTHLTHKICVMGTLSVKLTSPSLSSANTYSHFGTNGFSSHTHFTSKFPNFYQQYTKLKQWGYLRAQHFRLIGQILRYVPNMYQIQP